MSLAAERLRGIALSHRDWVMADGARARLRAQWRELFRNFDAVICPVMPTPAYPHDHSEDQEKRRIIIDGKDFVYVDQLAWPGIATLPGLPATAIPSGLSPEGLPVGGSHRLRGLFLLGQQGADMLEGVQGAGADPGRILQRRSERKGGNKFLPYRCQL